MSCGIVRVQKMSSGSVKGIEIHDRREKEGASHTNPDIDWTHSHYNYDLHPAQNESFTRAVKERIAQLELPKAVRKDAVVMVQVLVTSDREYFDQLTPVQTKQFFEDAYSFLADRYGKKNIVSSVVHLDERTPHMHFNFVPVTEDGRLSAKSILTRQSLIEQQDRFAEEVGGKHGLDRGMTKAQRIEKGVERKNMTMPEYKGYMNEIHQLEKKADNMRQKAATMAQEVDNLENIKEQLESEKAALQGQRAALQSRLNNCNEFIARIDQIPKGKKNLLGKVEFTQQEATALIKTAETVYSARSTATRAVEDAERMKGTVSQLKKRPLEREVAALRDEKLELKHQLQQAQEKLRQVDKVFAQSPELAKLFAKVAQTLLDTQRQDRRLERS